MELRVPSGRRLLGLASVVLSPLPTSPYLFHRNACPRPLSKSGTLADEFVPSLTVVLRAGPRVDVLWSAGSLIPGDEGGD
jgi:hypothetical protein